MSRLWRVCPWDPAAAPGQRGHPLWIARALQGAGRHDNPELYGAMYLSEQAVAAVAESISHLRGQALDDADLERGGLRLALVALDARLDRPLWDLDDPRVLVDRRLRPSQVATRTRELTRRQAADLFRARPRRAGLRWWSTIESSWLHVTLFDRAAAGLEVAARPDPLRTTNGVVQDAAEMLGVLIR